VRRAVLYGFDSFGSAGKVFIVLECTLEKFETRLVCLSLSTSMKDMGQLAITKKWALALNYSVTGT
jgi:hypothetical protein